MDLFQILYSLASVTGETAENCYSLFVGIPRSILAKKEVKFLDYMSKSFEDNRGFPPIAIMSKLFGEHKPICKNTTDITIAIKELVEKRTKEKIVLDINEALSEDFTSENLIAKLAEITTSTRVVNKSNITRPVSMASSYRKRKDCQNNIVTGIKDLDSLTNGWQAGLLHSICGFTSSGKSSFAVNSIYKNIQNGKKVVILSLEIPKDFMYLTFYSRHSHTMGSDAIAYSDIYNTKITEEQEAYLFDVVEKDFENLPGELVVLEQSDIAMYNFSGLCATLKEAEVMMGGLDYFIIDHINLVQYITGPDNRKLDTDDVVKTLADIAREYKNQDDLNISVGILVQTNREGYKRAVRNKGVYDLLAVSEFREIERSSTYVVFIYTDPGMLRANEMKVQLRKNRVGKIQEDPITTYYYPPCAVIGEQFDNVSADNDMESLFNSSSSDFSGLDDLFN